MFDQITPEQIDLIQESRIFFVASVDPNLTPGPAGEGPVNLSPKGGVPLHVLDNHRVAYLDYPGSGNETRRHAEANGAITIMVMSMSAEDAAIVRLYGKATVMEIEECPYAEQIVASPSDNLGKPRQIIEVQVDATQTSCGYGVPIYEYAGERSKAGRGRRYK